MNLTLFHNVNSTKYGGQCYQDPSFYNLYIYSVKCRYWFEKQLKQYKSKGPLFSLTYTASSITGNIEWASKGVWGMTICAPLSNRTSSFIGAYCADINTTMGSIRLNQDNYLDMYLSQTYADTSNYIIFKSDSFVSIIIIIFFHSGRVTSQISTILLRGH